LAEDAGSLTPGPGSGFDVDLAGENAAIEKHEGGEAPPLSRRPRRGRLGFQDLSNPGEQLLFRNARIAVLDWRAGRVGLRLGPKITARVE
jgi:hypothetical protein